MSASLEEVILFFGSAGAEFAQAPRVTRSGYSQVGGAVSFYRDFQDKIRFGENYAKDS